MFKFMYVNAVKCLWSRDRIKYLVFQAGMVPQLVFYGIQYSEDLECKCNLF